MGAAHRMFDSSCNNRYYDLILNSDLLLIDPHNYHETKKLLCYWRIFPVSSKCQAELSQQI